MAESGDFRHRFLGRFIDNQVREGHIRAFRGEFEGDGLADAARGAGDEGHLSS